MDAIICDIDGTLAFKGNRGIFEYEKAGVDSVNEPIRFIVQTLANSENPPKVIICSGRMDYGEDVLRGWLETHQIPFDALFMRKTDDMRPDDIVKREIFENEIRDKYNILFVLDDRTKVVNMWRNIGLTCLQVAPGDF